VYFVYNKKKTPDRTEKTMSQKTQVKFYHVGDSDYNGSLLVVCDSKRAALEYVRDWLNTHSTRLYPFAKVDAGRWESKFSAVYIEKA
jgi:hypothetical protein